MLTIENLAQLIDQFLLPILLAVPRMLAACGVVPLIGSAAIPQMGRITFVLSLAIFLYPLNSDALPSEPLGIMLWLVIAVKEILIGFCLGYVCSIFIWVVEGIGSLLDTVVGNNNLFLFNPMLNQQSGPFSILLGQFGAILFIMFGGFIILLHTLFTSFVIWPVLSFYPSLSDASRTFFIERSSEILAVSVQLAMPTLTVLMLVDLGLGLLNRSASQLNAYALSMPIKAILSVLFLALTLVFIGDSQGPLAHLMDLGKAFLRVAI